MMQDMGYVPGMELGKDNIIIWGRGFVSSGPNQQPKFLISHLLKPDSVSSSHSSSVKPCSLADEELRSPRFQLLFSLWGWDQRSPTKRASSPAHSALRSAALAKRVALATRVAPSPGISQSVGIKNLSAIAASSHSLHFHWELQSNHLANHHRPHQLSPGRLPTQDLANHHLPHQLSPNFLPTKLPVRQTSRPATGTDQSPPATSALPLPQLLYPYKNRRTKKASARLLTLPCVRVQSARRLSNKAETPHSPALIRSHLGVQATRSCSVIQDKEHSGIIMTHWSLNVLGSSNPPISDSRDIPGHSQRRSPIGRQYDPFGRCGCFASTSAWQLLVRSKRYCVSLWMMFGAL
ncbi:hypothetical protein AAY473_025683 [Plecturocebus cupreus]